MDNIFFFILYSLNAILFFLTAFIIVVILISLFVKQKKTKTYVPNVSIIMPVYNEEKNIPSFFQHLLDSNYNLKKIELIVVDDGSTDNSVKEIKKFANKISITILKTSHVGKVDAINRGVQEAKNEIILCFDADAFLEKSAIQNMVMAFYDIRVGAVSGVCLVKNNNSVLNIFQSVEYYYVSLVRRAFSEVFGIGIWFFGAVIGFRKTVYEEVGGFKKDTLAEDNKFCLDVFSKGYKVVTVHNAIAHTPVPESISGLFKQRMRWYVGALQCVSQSVSNVSKKNIFYAFFLVFSQFFWGFYALISVPLVTYQFLYWLPSFANPILVLDYFFRWMSFYGAIFTIYMAQQWGLTLFELLGCVIGAITFIVIMLAFHLFRARFSIRKLLALFFYFPYAILLNTILAISLIKFFFTKKGEHFRK